MTAPTRYLDPEIIQRVSRLDLRARFIVEGFLAGRHRSPFQGLTVEFAEHRKYTPGDDLRTIDWRVYARTDRLFVRKYAAETHLQCHLLVDASASMGRVGWWDDTAADPAGGGKLPYAVHLAAAIGYLVTRQQDAIGLGVIGPRLLRMLPARSRRQDLIHLLAELAAIEPAGETGLAAGIHEAMRRIAHRGVVIVLSDLLTDPHELLEALHHVRFRGHDLIVMHILDQAEADLPLRGPLRLEDPESGYTLEADGEGVRRQYAAAIADWRGELQQRLAGLRADYVPLDTSMPFDKALVEFLLQRSRRR